MFSLNTQLVKIIKFRVYLQEDTIAQIFAEPIPLSWGDVSTDWEHTLYISLWGRRGHNVKRSWGQSGKCSSVAYPELKSITAVALYNYSSLSTSDIPDAAALLVSNTTDAWKLWLVIYLLNLHECNKQNYTVCQLNSTL